MPTTVELQLGWNVAEYDIVTGKLAGPSRSLRDPEESAKFAARDQRLRHEANRMACVEVDRMNGRSILR